MHSRSRGCLYRASEFPGCDPSAPEESCIDICAELTARVATDAARTFDASVRLNSCRSGDCATIIEIEGVCYVGHSEAPRDCSLSDGELLETE